MLPKKATFALILFGLWLLLSGHAAPFPLLTGLACAVGVSLLAVSVPQPSRRWLGWLRYGPWLLAQIALANWHVAKLILRSRPQLAPKLIHYTTHLPTLPLRALLCQSITLTPGTITTHLDERTGKITVHAIDDASAEGLMNGDFEQTIRNAYLEPALTSKAA
jgi:multicomponent Na+:H+ antiporter subunit E